LARARRGRERLELPHEGLPALGIKECSLIPEALDEAFQKSGITHILPCFAHVTALRFSARLTEGSSEMGLASVWSLPKNSEKPFPSSPANGFAPRFITDSSAAASMVAKKQIRACRLSGVRQRCYNKIGDGACEPSHESRIHLKSQYPPALLGLTWQHQGRTIAQIPPCTCSAQLVIRHSNGCCTLMPKNSKPDRPVRHHPALGTILAKFPYILLSQERYRRNQRSTSRETTMSGRRITSADK
jgi:hypothetical protein